MPGSQEVPAKAIITFRDKENGPLFYADILEGIDFTLTPPYYMDPDKGRIKVGVFAKEEKDGTLKSLRYRKKVLYPNKGYLKATIHELRRDIWFSDLQAVYRERLKLAEDEPDPGRKKRRLIRLVHWCRANFHMAEAEPLEKELESLENAAPAIAEGDGAIAENFRRLSGAGDVIVRRSPHIVIASDCLSVPDADRLLLLGERVFEDFGGFMYHPAVPEAPDLPKGEMLRFFYFDRIITMEEALTSAGSLAFRPNLKKGTLLSRILEAGAAGHTHRGRDHTRRSFMACRERWRLRPYTSIVKSDWFLDELLIHQLGHALMINRMRHNYVGANLIMPWMEEGMALYLTVKHLGMKRSACVDFGHYAHQGDGSRFLIWEGDVERKLHRSALSKEAEDLGSILRISHLDRLTPSNLAKAFSFIDFMMEKGPAEFLLFVEGYQECLRIFHMYKDREEFSKGLDDLAKETFSGPDSVDTLEAAWQEWVKVRVK